MDDLRDENLDEEMENTDALLDDSIFEETDLDVLGEDDDLKPIADDSLDPDEEEEEEEEEIFDELDALAAEEDEEEGFDFYGDEDDY